MLTRIDSRLTRRFIPLIWSSLSSQLPFEPNPTGEEAAVVSQWTESNPSNPNGCEIGLEMRLRAEWAERAERAERGEGKINAALSSVCDGL